jgi:hypothetical protein
MSMLRIPLTVLFSALACPAVHGCTAVEGGAIEASWNLRTTAGSDLDCDEAGVTEIRLYVGDRRFDFECSDARGVTGFDIPPGTVSITLVPLCADSMPPPVDTYRSPAEIVRVITEGEVITLDTQLI